jgi:hypothetical protein
MKKTMTTAMIALFTSLCACAIDTDDELMDIEEETSEISSEIAGTVICTGYGAGTCTASSMPTGWTITGVGAGANIYPNGLTATWSCRGTVPTRLVTAVGVGTATVQCSRR